MKAENIVVQQYGDDCVSVEKGSVPVMNARNGFFETWAVAMAVSFLRCGCPRVQVLNLRNEQSLQGIKQTVQSLQLPGEKLEVTVDSQSPLVFSIHRA